jgi:hypothetical protein
MHIPLTIYASPPEYATIAADSLGKSYSQALTRPVTRRNALEVEILDDLLVAFLAAVRRNREDSHDCN